MSELLGMSLCNTYYFTPGETKALLLKVVVKSYSAKVLCNNVLFHPRRNQELEHSYVQWKCRVCLSLWCLFLEVWLGY